MKVFSYALFYIYLIQGICITLVIIFSVYFEKMYKRKEKKQQQFKAIMLACVKQEFPLEKLPSHLREFQVIIPVLEELDQKIASPFWEQMKESLIHGYLYFDIKKNLRRERWDQISWALRGLRLCPKVENESAYLEYLSHDNISVRLLAIDGALKLQTKPLIAALLSHLGSLHEYFKFPYLDALLRGDENVWKKVVAIYREDPLLRDSAIEVLSRKGGLLTLEDIVAFLPSFSKQSRRWAIEALAQVPSEKTSTILLEELKAPEWERRLHATYLLGQLRAKPHPNIEALLKDDVKKVRLAAGWALFHHKKELPEEIAEYFASYPSRDIEKYLKPAFESQM